MTTLHTGLYRNHCGAELSVLSSIASRQTYRVTALGDDARLAVSRDELFGDSLFVVSASSLASAGYVHVDDQQKGK